VARCGRPEWIDLERLMALVNEPAAGIQLLPEDRLNLGPMPGSPEGVLERLAALEAVIARDKAA
jgi:hypothetical protein